MRISHLLYNGLCKKHQILKAPRIHKYYEGKKYLLLKGVEELIDEERMKTETQITAKMVIEEGVTRALNVKTLQKGNHFARRRLIQGNKEGRQGTTGNVA